MTTDGNGASRDESAAAAAQTRRHFFRDCGVGLGAIALSSISRQEAGADDGGTAKSPAAPPAATGDRATEPLAVRPTHFKPRAKSVIFLFMAGGPSQLELFDNKPKLTELHGKPTPESLLKGKRFAFLKGVPTLLGIHRKFARHGKSGAELSELLPHTAAIADDIAIVRGMATDVFNHGPAKLFVNTGSPQFQGRPAMGSWVTYGIGSPCRSLPGFVVLQSGPRGPRGGAALWGSGFLPTAYQGVPFRSTGEPIVNLSSPKGVTDARQRDLFDAVGDLNRMRLADTGDPEIAGRIAQYEMAYRMQSAAPELINIRDEPAKVLEAYGAEPGKPSYAANCLLARRLVERGVRFVQLYHTDWDHHGDGINNLNKGIELRCRETDRASAALVADLKAKGLLDDTLVIWGGEFGRTPMGEPRDVVGRDHHVDAYTMWMAGGGVKAGLTLGATDELGFSITEDRVHVHDLQATVLHLLGLDHKKLTFRFQGRDFRLTDVHGEVVHKLLA